MPKIHEGQVCENPLLTEELRQNCELVVEMQTGKITENTNGDIRDLIKIGLFEGATLAARLEQPFTVGNSFQTARQLAHGSYESTFAVLDDLKKNVEENGENASHIFDPTELYLNYWQARANHNLGGCLITDNSGLTFDEGVVQSGFGEESCDVLDEQERGIHRVVSRAQFIPASLLAQSNLQGTHTNALSQKSADVFLSTSVGLSEVKRFGELEGLETFYSSSRVAGGYKKTLAESLDVVGEVDFAKITSSGEKAASNLGTNFWQLGGFGGIKWSPYKGFFVLPLVGLEYSSHNTNLDNAGAPLAHGSALMAGTQIFVGRSFPISAASQVDLGLGGYYKRTLTGNPDFYSYGPSVMVNFTTDFNINRRRR